LIFVLSSRPRDSFFIQANAAPNAFFLFKTVFLTVFFFFFSENFYFCPFDQLALTVAFVADAAKIGAFSPRRRVKMTARRFR
jgi:hypothetical protein